MSKYYLVASYYDMYKKSYTNEIVISKLNNISLSSLIKIDGFTSEYSELEIFNMIEKELNIRGLNHLAIKYIKNDYERPIYYKVISNNKEFNDCVNSCKTREIILMNKYRKTYFVNLDNELFRKEIKELLDILKTKDYELFQEYYSKENDFSFLVNNYINSSYDNESYEEEDLKKIILEFSRYKTFRGWIINKNNPRKNLSQKPRTDNVIAPINIKQQKINSIEENIALYEKEYEKRTGKTYLEDATNYFNESNEEYLSEEEYRVMNGYSKKKY